MKLEHAEQLPGFIKKEIQKIQIAIAPLMKKSIIYRFLAFPLAAFSLFHLASLLIQALPGEELSYRPAFLPSLRLWVLRFLRKPAISGNRCKKRSAFIC